MATLSQRTTSIFAGLYDTQPTQLQLDFLAEGYRHLLGGTPTQADLAREMIRDIDALLRRRAQEGKEVVDIAAARAGARAATDAMLPVLVLP